MTDQQPDPWTPTKDEPELPVLRFRGAAIAALLISVLAAGLYFIGGVGWSLVGAGPFAVGLLASWLGKTLKQRLLILLGFSLLVPLGFLGIAFKDGEPGLGLFCGIVAMAGLIPGYLTGYGAGAAIRRLDTKRIIVRPLVAYPMTISLPLAAHALQIALALPVHAETVAVDVVSERSAAELFVAPILAGEPDPPTRAPFSIGLTRPRAASGDATSVGDIKTFRFDGGHLTVRVTESRPPERFAFEVIEQVRVEDRAARFLRGTMRFEDGATGTAVRVTATYEPLMTPRWYLRPVERWAARAVLEDVLDRMSNAAASKPQHLAGARP